VKRFFLLTAAFVAAVVVCTFATLPPARVVLPATPDDGTVAGVIHIHTKRSDGRGSPDEVAAAAAAAGLKFIVFTDHGDATRTPDPPIYRSGVLCIDAVEISTAGGHYVALGLPAAPYPLGGEPRDVVEDVARLGGFGVAAHPDSPKPDLRWTDWTAPFDGMEIVNPDSGWRRLAATQGWRPRLRMVARFFSYPVRPVETVATFAQASPDNLTRWDALARQRKVVGLAGADAHSKLELRSSEPGDNRVALPLPGYEATFRALSVHVTPALPLTGVADSDAASVLRGIRAGHLYTAIDGLASPPAFVFLAERNGASTGEGDEVPPGPLTLHVHSNAPRTFTTMVFEGERVVATSHEPEIHLPFDARSSVYRVEIHASDRARDPTWLMSNPIYVRSGSPSAAARATAAPATFTDPIFDGRNQADWSVEHDPASTASVVPATGEEGPLHLIYRLAPASGPSHAAVAVLRNLTTGLRGNVRVAFTARADRPMRVSVQLRTGPGHGDLQRWQRSIYLDTTDRDALLSFDDFTPIGDTRTFRPALADIRSLMFVVDTTNTRPGASGDVWLRNIAIER
jgi:hypothetical protein